MLLNNLMSHVPHYEINRLGSRTNFTCEIEHVKLLARTLYGVSAFQLKCACFQYAEANNLAHPSNKNKQIAGRDWYHGVLKCNPDIYVTSPEPTSLNRIAGLNKTEVSLFYSNL